MTIDPDVKRMAAEFGVDPALIQAVVHAEGDILKAVRCSLPRTKTREEALRITCRSAVHALSDFVKQDSPADFVAFWAQRWAPVGVANDPKALNQYWPRNVTAGWVTA
jgi:hypothetical protein